ncbi:MAG: glycosyltransferase [Actinomycetota bacterium]
MKILVWHGWLLTGSGSNVYNANIARCWRTAGHDVLLVCQDGDAHLLPFVDGVGAMTAGNSSFELTPTGAEPVAGSCVVVRPDIGRLLPVFVYDAYRGFEVKRFVDLTGEELDGYVEHNVRALAALIETWGPDAIITGHEVMGPEIARRACEQAGTRYLAKLHGSGLEYAVKLQGRYRELAASGLNGANVVVGGSEYMVQAAGAVIPGEWQQCARVVNPGCDVELFKPVDRRSSALTVAYVGKLIASKGVHDLLAALGLTTRALRSVVVGYGGFENELHILAAALQKGDLDSARAIAERGEGLPLKHLSDFLRDPPPGFFERMSRVEVEFTGRLEHGPLSLLLPTFDVLVVPSVLPEAFGMVAAEAAACGVLPIVPDHSGIAEAGAAVEQAIGAPGLLTFDSNDPIRGIADAIDRVLTIPVSQRAEMGRAAADLAHERWSWERVSTRLLGLATMDGADDDDRL